MMNMSITDNLKIAGQYCLPKHALSRLVGKLAAAEAGNLTTRVIEAFIKQYQVDMSEALHESPAHYKSFNEFFTRELKPGIRPLVEDAMTLALPVDGTVSQLGPIQQGRIIQAKGHDYSARELLGGYEDLVAPFKDGDFATIYLAPKDYHRIHMPLDGVLESMVFVPGISSPSTRSPPRTCPTCLPATSGWSPPSAPPRPHGAGAGRCHYRGQHRDHLGRQHSADQREARRALGLQRRRSHHPAKGAEMGLFAGQYRGLSVWPGDAGRFRASSGQRGHHPHGSALCQAGGAGMSEQPASSQKNNPLHGLTLEAIVTALVAHYGWEELGQQINIRCFTDNPSIKSSLKFLRKTPGPERRSRASICTSSASRPNQRNNAMAFKITYTYGKTKEIGYANDKFNSIYDAIAAAEGSTWPASTPWKSSWPRCAGVTRRA